MTCGNRYTYCCPFGETVSFRRVRKMKLGPNNSRSPPFVLEVDELTVLENTEGYGVMGIADSVKADGSQDTFVFTVDIPCL